MKRAKSVNTVTRNPKSSDEEWLMPLSVGVFVDEGDDSVGVAVTGCVVDMDSERQRFRRAFPPGWLKSLK